MKAISTRVNRSIQHPIAQPAPVASIIEGHWRERKARHFRMNRYAWLVALSFLLFAAVFASVIASQQWEYAVVFSGAFAGGCMFTVFAAVLVVWVATHR